MARLAAWDSSETELREAEATGKRIKLTSNGTATGAAPSASAGISARSAMMRYPAHKGRARFLAERCTHTQKGPRRGLNGRYAHDASDPRRRAVRFFRFCDEIFHACNAPICAGGAPYRARVPAFEVLVAQWSKKQRMVVAPAERFGNRAGVGCRAIDRGGPAGGRTVCWLGTGNGINQYGTVRRPQLARA